MKPPIEGPNTSVNPPMNHRVDKIARPEKVCMMTESEFLVLMRPASKNPRAGIISNTSPVDTNIHAVSPVSIDISNPLFQTDNIKMHRRMLLS